MTDIITPIEVIVELREEQRIENTNFYSITYKGNKEKVLNKECRFHVTSFKEVLDSILEEQIESIHISR